MHTAFCIASYLHVLFVFVSFIFEKCIYIWFFTHISHITVVDIELDAMLKLMSQIFFKCDNTSLELKTKTGKKLLVMFYHLSYELY